MYRVFGDDLRRDDIDPPWQHRKLFRSAASGPNRSLPRIRPAGISRRRDLWRRRWRRRRERSRGGHFPTLRIVASIDDDGRRRPTAATGPRPRNKWIQQSTTIICEGFTSL